MFFSHGTGSQEDFPNSSYLKYLVVQVEELDALSVGDIKKRLGYIHQNFVREWPLEGQVRLTISYYSGPKVQSIGDVLFISGVDTAKQRKAEDCYWRYGYSRHALRTLSVLTELKMNHSISNPHGGAHKFIYV